MPLGDVAGIGGCAVVIVLEWRDLRFRISGYQAIFRIERLCNIVVDAQGPVENPLLLRPGPAPMDNAQPFQRSLRQKRAAAYQRCYSSCPEEQNIAARPT